MDAFEELIAEEFGAGIDQRNIFRPMEDMRLKSPLRPEPFLDAYEGRTTRCKGHSAITEELESWYDIRRQLMDRGITLSNDYIRMIGCVLKDLGEHKITLAAEFNNHRVHPRMVHNSLVVTLRHMKSVYTEVPTLEIIYEQVYKLSALSKTYTIARESAEFTLRCHIDSKCLNPVIRLPFTSTIGSVHYTYAPMGPNTQLCKYRKAVFLLHLKNGKVLCQFLYGDALRCLCDLICMRQLVLLAVDFAGILSEPGYPSTKQIEDFFDAGDDILVEFGNRAYDVLKNHEALCVGRLITLAKEDYITDTACFWSFITKEILEEFDHPCIHRYLSLIKKLDVPDVISQIYGLFRLWGHPLVDVPAGLNKIKAVATRYKAVDTSLVMNITCQFKEMFAEKYFATHHTWPAHALSERGLQRRKWTAAIMDLKTSGRLREESPHISIYTDSEVIRALRSNTPINKNSKHYRLQDWCNVIFQQTFYPDTGINTLALLSDKAACVDFEELKKQVAQRKLPKSEDRRVLLMYLRKTEVDTEELLRSIDQNGLDTDKLVIGLTPKEREMKVCPRMFSLMTFDFRLYITATEKMISDYILKYMPQITMRDTGNELLKKMLYTSKRVGVSGNSVNVLINMDFEKWNLHQRGLLVNPIFRNIDYLLGFRSLISRTHEFFEKSTFCCLDGYYFPDFDRQNTSDQSDDPYSWTHHLGGIEGLRQKGWTIVTCTVIAYAARLAGLVAEIKGSGDNQVVLLEIPIRYPSQDDPELRDSLRADVRVKYYQFMDLLYDCFTKIGLPIKKEETWASTTLFAYGKCLFFEGRSLPMSLKRICRILHSTNEAYPAFINQVSGIFGACEAACENSYMAHVSYCISLYEVSIAYRWALIWTPALPGGLRGWRNQPAHRLKFPDGSCNSVDIRKLKCTSFERDLRDWLECMTLINASFGGYATQPLLGMITRGFPDRVSLGIAAIRAYLVHNQDVNDVVRSALLNSLCPKSKDAVDYTMLAEDPTSLNILRPIQPKNILKRGVLEFLSSGYVRNNLVQDLVYIDKGDLPVICSRMSLMTPLMPRFMSTLLDCSPSGIAMSFLGTFERTDTVQKVARKSAVLRASCSRMLNLERDLGRAELDAHLYFMYICSGSEIPPDLCDYDLAQNIRCRTWKRDDICGVTVPHPISYTVFVPVQLGNCSVCKSFEGERVTHSNGARVEEVIPSHVLINIMPEIRYDPTIVERKNGPTLPYVGSTTFERPSVRSEVKFRHSNVPLKHAMKCLRSVGWLYDLEGLMGVDISKRIASITDIPISMLITDIMKSESSALHRYRDARLPHGGAPGTLPSVFSWFEISTSTMGCYAKGEQNHPIHYQQLMSYAQMQAYLYMRFGAERCEDTTCVHLHVCNTSNIPPLGESKIVIPEKHQLEVESWVYNSYKNSKVLFAHLDTSVPYTRPIVRLPLEYTDFRDFTDRQCKELRDQLHTQSILRCILSASHRTAGTWAKSSSLDFIWYIRMDPRRIFINVAAALIACTFEIRHIEKPDKYRSIDSIIDGVMSQCMREVLEMPNLAFESLALMYSVINTRKKISRCSLLHRARNIMCSIEEACSYARASLLNIMQQIASGRLQYPDTLPFSVELIGSPITPREININLYSTILRMHNKQCDITFTELRRLRNVLYKYLHSEPFRIVSILRHDPDDLSLFIKIQPSLRGKLREAFRIVRIPLTSTLLEKELRNVSVDMYDQAISPYEPSLSPMDIYHLKSSIEVLVKTDTSIKQVQRCCVLKPTVHTAVGSGDRVTPLRYYLRPYPNSGTSYYKYVPLLLTSVVRTDCMVVACLADGGGGVARVCYRLFRPKILFFNTLIQGNASHQEHRIGLTAPFLDDLDDCIIVGQSLLQNGMTDITDPGFAQACNYTLNGKKVNLVTCDAESKDEDGTNKSISQYPKCFRILTGLIRFIDANCEVGSTLIWKTYATDVDFLIIAYSWFLTGYSQVKIVRSRFTSNRSAEVFFCCMRLHSKFIAPTIIITGTDRYFRISLPDCVDRQFRCFPKIFDGLEITDSDLKCSDIICRSISEPEDKQRGLMWYYKMACDCGMLKQSSAMTVLELWRSLHNNLHVVFQNRFIPQDIKKYEYRRVLTHSRGQQLLEMYIFLLVCLKFPRNVRPMVLHGLSKYWCGVILMGKRYGLYCRPGQQFYDRLHRLYVKEITHQKTNTWIMLSTEHNWCRQKQAHKWYQLFKIIEDYDLDIGNPDKEYEKRCIISHLDVANYDVFANDPDAGEVIYHLVNSTEILE